MPSAVKGVIMVGQHPSGSAPLASPSDLWLNPLTHKRVRYRDIWFVDDSGVLQPGKCDLRKREAQDYVLTHNYFGDGTEPSTRHCRPSHTE